MHPVTDLIALVLFPALMTYSALSDLFTMTIANWISIVLVVGFSVLAVLSGMPVREIGIDHLACGAGVLILTFFMFARGWIGGGDAKLAAATAVWIGWTQLSSYALLASLLGAALTLSILRFRKFELSAGWMNQPWIARIHSRQAGIPYGIALAAAGLVIYPDTQLWRTVVGY